MREEIISVWPVSSSELVGSGSLLASVATAQYYYMIKLLYCCVLHCICICTRLSR